MRGSSLASFERMRNRRPSGAAPAIRPLYFTENCGVAKDGDAPNRSVATIREKRGIRRMAYLAARWQQDTQSARVLTDGGIRRRDVRALLRRGEAAVTPFILRAVHVLVGALDQGFDIVVGQGAARQSDAHGD